MEKAYECARKLKVEMNKFYHHMKPHEVLLDILQTCGLKIHPGFTVTKINTDGHRLCMSNPTILLKVKNETVSTGVEPSFHMERHVFSSPVLHHHLR